MHADGCTSLSLLLKRSHAVVLTFSTHSSFGRGSYRGARFDRLVGRGSGGRGVWPCMKPSSCICSWVRGAWSCYKSEMHARVSIELLLCLVGGRGRWLCALQGRCASGRQYQSGSTFHQSTPGTRFGLSARCGAQDFDAAGRVEANRGRGWRGIESIRMLGVRAQAPTACSSRATSPNTASNVDDTSWTRL